jgi:hypothetical protein
MRKNRSLVLLAMIVLPVVLAVACWAAQAWIVEILANPSRFWNINVTIVGQVQSVQAVPEGTTRGYYSILDESGPNPLTVKSADLPPVGRNYSVTGIVIQDPAKANIPVLKEVSRSSPGMASTSRYILIGAAIVFLVLLIAFIVLLTRPKKKTGDTIRPAARPSIPPAAPDFDKTVKMPVSSPAPALADATDKTQVFMSLGADMVVDKGPGKGKEFPLYKQVMTIGRPGARKNDIEIDDDTVSKDQASIYYDNASKTFTIANESATNPTKVNGQIVSTPTLIENGALIEMGRTLLRFKKD